MKAGWLLLLLITTGFAGCSYTVEDLAADAEARNRILKECAEMGAASQNEELCKIAARAQVEAAKRSITGAFE